jgi:hypothetical protein
MRGLWRDQYLRASASGRCDRRAIGAPGIQLGDSGNGRWRLQADGRPHIATCWEAAVHEASGRERSLPATRRTRSHSFQVLVLRSVNNFADAFKFGED